MDHMSILFFYSSSVPNTPHPWHTTLRFPRCPLWYLGSRNLLSLPSWLVNNTALGILSLPRNSCINESSSRSRIPHESLRQNLLPQRDDTTESKWPSSILIDRMAILLCRHLGLNLWDRKHTWFGSIPGLGSQGNNKSHRVERTRPMMWLTILVFYI